MQNKFNPHEFERRWQTWWEENKAYQTPPVDGDHPTSKAYILDMFPYPSAQGLHVGHPEGYTATDIYARYLRMKGNAVLHPMGWDAFGLPAENYAIKQGVHPKETTQQAIDNFRRQIKSLGFSYDWEKELATCDPEYYRFTQWHFEFLYKQGLAYKKKAPANWCPSCQTVLANEQVVEGKCERCGSAVIQKNIAQWFFRITQFADELLDGLKKLDWPDSTKIGQINWIGRSEGLTIKFPILQDKSAVGSEPSAVNEKNIVNSQPSAAKSVEVFTTRPDTLFGVTFLVLAPEHQEVLKITDSTHMPQVKEYQKQTKLKTSLERSSATKKTGVFTGAYGINPLTKEKIPIYISDYILMDYGVGAIMGVPAHDKRDYDFAKTMGLDIKIVCVPFKTYNKLTNGDNNNYCCGKSGKIREIITAKDANKLTQNKEDSHDERDNLIEQIINDGSKFPYEEHGVIINSNKYSGLNVEDCISKISKDIISSGNGERNVKYKLRDWLISRQRYWGAPIPIIYCEMCGENLVPEEELPVILPTDVDFRPKGESPLQRSVLFHQVKCPKCGGKARRESDTMDTFVCSSWYFFAFVFWEKYCKDNQKHQIKSIYDTYKDEIRAWLPVDLYVGGAEHTVLHLLYARFFTKALHRAGLVPFDEPFMKLRHVGMILGLDGQKMSKSRGNVINPDEIVNKFGADTMRMYEMFMGPLSDKKAWNMYGVEGSHRFLRRVWHLVDEIDRKYLDCEHKEIWQITQKLAYDVANDIQDMKFNTAIAKMMTWLNETIKLAEHITENSEQREVGLNSKFCVLNSFKIFLRVLAPFAPHLSEELWFKLSGVELINYRSIHLESWPIVAKDTIINTSDQVFLVEVNGKVIEKIQNSEFRIQNSEKEMGDYSLNLPKVKNKIAGRPIRKTVFVSGKLINFVF